MLWVKSDMRLAYFSNVLAAYRIVYCMNEKVSLKQFWGYKLNHKNSKSFSPSTKGNIWWYA